MVESDLHQAGFRRAASLLLRGDYPGAAAAADAMEARFGETPSVLWVRARLALAANDGVGARAVLDRLLRAPIGEEQRAEGELLLGLALGLAGDTPGAFAAANQGKRRQRALHASVAAMREGEVDKLRRIARWLATAPPMCGEHRVAVNGAAATHVFVLGFPRSGTTLLEQILAAHPDIVTLEEEATLAAAFQGFLADERATRALAEAGADELAAWAAHYWQGVRARGVEPADRVFVDKQPAGTLLLPVIAKLFPDARILFALRDPRDVVLSCYRQPFALNAMTYAFTDLCETALCYDACLTLAGIARQKLPLAWMDVRHEALVDDLDGAVSRLSTFLRLAPSAAMADYAASARHRTIRTPSAAEARTGIDRRGVGRWQAYCRELAPALPILAPWVERLGYPPDSGEATAGA